MVNGRARQFVSACARDFGKQGFGEWKGASDTKEIVVDTNRGRCSTRCQIGVRTLTVAEASLRLTLAPECLEIICEIKKNYEANGYEHFDRLIIRAGECGDALR